jgi:hypothetical protein
LIRAIRQTQPFVDSRQMVRIAVTPAAFDAIAATLALGSLGFEAASTESGERQIWIDARAADRLAAMRGPGESYSDVILRLVELEGNTASR